MSADDQRSVGWMLPKMTICFLRLLSWGVFWGVLRNVGNLIFILLWIEGRILQETLRLVTLTLASSSASFKMSDILEKLFKLKLRGIAYQNRHLKKVNNHLYSSFLCLKHLWQRFNIICQKNYVINILVDYVYLMDDLRKELLKHGYILVVLECGVTRFI